MVLRSGCTISRSCWQCGRVSVALHVLLTSVWSGFYILAIRAGMQCYFLVVLIFQFPPDVERVFKCLFAIYMSSLLKCIFKPWVHFKN